MPLGAILKYDKMRAGVITKIYLNSDRLYSVNFLDDIINILDC